MASSAFNHQSSLFLSWFKGLPGATFHSDIEIADLRDRNAGRGIVATADIAPETVLFTIPRNSILCAKTSDLPARIPDVFSEDTVLEDDEDDSKIQDPWSMLILIMIYEHLRGDKSLWKPYFDVLPTAFETPMFWSGEELNELQASSIVGRIGRDSVSQMIHDKILSVIRAHEEIFFPSAQDRLSDDRLMELAHRMGSTIMAYAFDLENDDEEEAQNEEDEWVEDKEGRVMMGMVPMADILNADAQFNAHINHGEECLTATALRPIRAGEEILNYYGPLPNGELLRRYGYVTREHARHDVVELPWSLLEKNIKESLPLQPGTWEEVMQEIDPEEIEDGFVLERESEDPDATGQVHGEPVFQGLPEELEEQVKSFLKIIRKVAPEAGLDDKSRRQELYLASVLRALKEREAQYQTTLEQDDDIITRNNAANRAAMAVFVRRGEKLLLRDAQAWVQAELEKLRASIVDQDGPAPKRQRTRA